MSVDMWGETPKKAKRQGKKRKRLPFGQKAAFILHMMDENARILEEIRGVRGWGFKMSEIADMTRYERSTALLNDLFRMCEEGMLFSDTRPNPSCGVSPVTHYFFTEGQWPHALKQKRMTLS